MCDYELRLPLHLLGVCISQTYFNKHIVKCKWFIVKKIIYSTRKTYMENSSQLKAPKMYKIIVGSYLNKEFHEIKTLK